MGNEKQPNNPSASMAGDDNFPGQGGRATRDSGQGRQRIRVRREQAQEKVHRHGHSQAQAQEPDQQQPQTSGRRAEESHGAPMISKMNVNVNAKAKANRHTNVIEDGTPTIALDTAPAKHGNVLLGLGILGLGVDELDAGKVPSISPSPSPSHSRTRSFSHSQSHSPSPSHSHSRSQSYTPFAPISTTATSSTSIQSPSSHAVVTSTPTISPPPTSAPTLPAPAPAPALTPSFPTSTEPLRQPSTSSDEDPSLCSSLSTTPYLSSTSGSLPTLGSWETIQQMYGGADQGLGLGQGQGQGQGRHQPSGEGEEEEEWHMEVGREWEGKEAEDLGRERERERERGTGRGSGEDGVVHGEEEETDQVDLDNEVNHSRSEYQRKRSSLLFLGPGTPTSSHFLNPSRHPNSPPVVLSPPMVSSAAPTPEFESSPSSSPSRTSYQHQRPHLLTHTHTNTNNTNGHAQPQFVYLSPATPSSPTQPSASASASLSATSNSTSFSPLPPSPMFPYTQAGSAHYGTSVDQFRSGTTMGGVRSPIFPAPSRTQNQNQNQHQQERQIYANGPEEVHDDESRGRCLSSSEQDGLRTPEFGQVSFPTRTLIGEPPSSRHRNAQESKSHDESVFKKPFPPPLNNMSVPVHAGSQRPHFVPSSPTTSFNGRYRNGHRVRTPSISSGFQSPASPHIIHAPSHSPRLSQHLSSEFTQDIQQHAHNQLQVEQNIHARNLSIFFPEPGKDYTSEELEIQQRHEQTRRRAQRSTASISYEPDHQRVDHSKPGAANGFSFGRPSTQTPNGGHLSPSLMLAPTSPGLGRGPPRSPSIGSASSLAPPISTQQPVGRRGHHHRHSLSHNFFDVGQNRGDHPSGQGVHTIPIQPDQSETHEGAALNHRLDTPKPVSSAFITGAPPVDLFTSSSSSSSLPILPTPTGTKRSSQYSMFSLGLQSQCRFLFGLFEMALGMSLWVHGQSGSGLAVSGLGYFVVFDALGVLLGVWEKMSSFGSGILSSSKLPFGSLRRGTLVYYTQIIFLGFSGVYIIKEAVESVMMSGSDDDHGHGGHSHSAKYPEYPTVLIACSTVSALVSSCYLGNHVKLLEALLSNNTAGRLITSYMHPLERFLSNPFSAVVLAANVAGLLCALLLPQAQMPQANHILPFAQASACFWLAYPAAIAFYRVLMQTAPLKGALQMSSMDGIIEEIKAHPSIIRVSDPHIWQLTPHNPKDTHRAFTPRPTPIHSRTSSFTGIDTLHDIVMTPRNRRRRTSDPDKQTSVTPGPVCILVATLELIISHEADDKIIFEVTQFAYGRCCAALWATRGELRGQNAGKAGEITIKVTREGDETRQKIHSYEHDEHCRHDDVHQDQHQGHQHKENHRHGHHHGDH